MSNAKPHTEKATNSGEAAAVWVDIGELKAWENNPRKNDQAVDGIVKSIKAFGFGAPILARSSNREVIAGHTRLKAAAKLGLHRVPVRYLDLDAEQAHLLALADNRLGENAEWDDELLSAILGDLKQKGEDLDLSGFDSDELDKLLGDDVPDGDDDVAPVDQAAELQKKWGTELGQLWQIGPHRLLCGDSTNPEDVARLMGGKRAKLALHDPPYGIKVVESGLVGDGKRFGNAVAPRGTFKPIHGDGQPFDPSHIVASGDVVFIWGANHFADKLPPRASWTVWDKRVDLPSNEFSDCELAWVSGGGDSARILRHAWMGMIRDSEMGEPRVHPTQKPIQLHREIVQTYTKQSDLVTDWYHGSGTTMIACQQSDRVCFAMEIDPGYVAVALERMSAIGCDPVLSKN